MADIKWEEIKVTIEKIEDPSVVNAVMEYYEKAQAAADEALRYRADVHRMSRARNSFNHEEEYHALYEKSTTFWKEKGYYSNKEYQDINRRMSEIREESIPKYDEIHGKEYDMALDRFVMYQEKARMMMEEAKKKLIAIGIHDEKERELERKITNYISYNMMVQEEMLTHWKRQ